MRKLFLFLFLTLIFWNNAFARKTGCEGDCENGFGTWTYTDQTVYDLLNNHSKVMTNI